MDGWNTGSQEEAPLRTSITSRRQKKNISHPRIFIRYRLEQCRGHSASGTCTKGQVPLSHVAPFPETTVKTEFSFCSLI